MSLYLWVHRHLPGEQTREIWWKTWHWRCTLFEHDMVRVSWSIVTDSDTMQCTRCQAFCVIYRAAHKNGVRPS